MNTPEQKKAVVYRFNKEFIEGASMEAFQQIVSPSFINHSAAPDTPSGPDGVIYFFNEMLRPGIPDLSVEIFAQTVEGDSVTTRKAFHGTHSGELFGFPATGRKVRIDVIDIVKVRDGQMQEHWGIFDSGAVMAQIAG